MSARPSSFRKAGGGGYLNNITANLTGYEFLVGEPALIKKGQRKGEMFTPLSLVPSFRVDGADEDLTQRLLIGDASQFGDVSEDGQVLATPDGQFINDTCEAGIFLSSLCKNGFDETRFSESATEIDLTPMVGSRVELVQVVNEEKTKRQGKQIGKNGQEYDRRDLQVKSVISSPALGKGASKAVAKTNGTKAAKGVDVASLAAETVLGIVVAAGDAGVKAKTLKMKIFAVLGTSHPQRDPVILWAGDNENLAGIDGVDFDGTTLSIAA